MIPERHLDIISGSLGEHTDIGAVLVLLFIVLLFIVHSPPTRFFPKRLFFFPCRLAGLRAFRGHSTSLEVESGWWGIRWKTLGREHMMV